MPTIAEAFETTRQQLEMGDTGAAWSALRPLLEYPGQLSDEADWKRALELLTQISNGFGAEKLEERCRAVAQKPAEPDALYDAAFELYEQQLHGPAATLLARANTLAPGRAGIITELAGNLEAMRFNVEACRVLRAAPQVLEADPFARYLLAFNAIMSGDLEDAREVLGSLRNVGDAQLATMVSLLDGMLARAGAALKAKASTLDNRDLIGWHLVINGSVLLHRSPHGLDEPMHGRYAYVSDSFALIREGIDRLGAVLAAAERRPKSIAAIPGRDHEIVATAASQILGIPVVPWEKRVEGPCLIVAYDLDRMGDVAHAEVLRSHAPGQMLFAHASCWTNPYPFAPDFTTFLYQTNASPWGAGRLQVDPETKQVKQSEADETPLGELAKKIVDAKPPDDSPDDLAAISQLVQATSKLPSEQRPGLFRESGPRLRQRAGSPVQSAAFL
ncbi:MAG: hypothetical protein JST54_17950 [Deltaproteobacteria bacterium]|nr:hypothetical protein [Deltaproteobacteria bacterium]